jgi:nuclear GTP-binding protein
VDEQARLVLLNAVPAKQIGDPIPAVSLLLRRLGSSADGLQRLLEYYSAPPLMPGPGGDPTMDFLIHVARKRGRLGRGGIPNTHSAAMAVLVDWRDGRIQGWTEPPTSRAAKTPASAAAPVAAAGDGNRDGDGKSMADDGGVIVGGDHKTIVSTWAAEFKLEGLWGDGEGDDE